MTLALTEITRKCQVIKRTLGGIPQLIIGEPFSPLKSPLFCPSQSVLEAKLVFGRWLECNFKAKMRGVQSGRSDELSLPFGQSAL